jgi:hypothetical protein
MAGNDAEFLVKLLEDSLELTEELSDSLNNGFAQAPDWERIVKLNAAMRKVLLRKAVDEAIAGSPDSMQLWLGWGGDGV